jgi:hypothetical protein
VKPARDRWFERLNIERGRRRDSELLIDGQDPKERFLSRLAEIGQRLCASPGFVEPDPEELRRNVDRWFKEHFPKAH